MSATDNVITLQMAVDMVGNLGKAGGAIAEALRSLQAQSEPIEPEQITAVIDQAVLLRIASDVFLMHCAEALHEGRG